MKKADDKLKRKRTNSKKGVTLIELVIGIAIIVIVFASTLSALTGGYTTTVNNANEDQEAAKCSSANEILMSTLNDLKITSKDDLDSKLAAATDPITTAVVVKFGPSIKYVAPSAYYSSTEDMKYTIEPDKTTTISGGLPGSNAVSGMIVKTSFRTSTGYVYNESFVPYAK